MQLNPVTQCGIDIKRFKKTKTAHKSGGSGYVYEVRDTKTKKLYAAKVIKHEYSEECIDREIGILMYANHPTIIKFIGFSFKDFNENENITIIMELAEKGSLQDVLNTIRSDEMIDGYDDTTRQIILIGVTRAMKYLHDRKIIHRDLKPANVLLNKDFHPLITDFGMSKFVNINDSLEQSIHGGTLFYMAPEIIDEKQYGRKADVYAFGILMYEIVTGLAPYSNKELSDGKFKFWNKVVNEDYRPKFVRPVKEPIKNLIERCWSKNPNDRPTFSELFKMFSNKEDGYFFDGVDFSKVDEYVESITKIDDAIEEFNFKIDKIEKDNQQLKRRLDEMNENIDEMATEKQQLENYNRELKLENKILKKKQSNKKKRSIEYTEEEEEETEEIEEIIQLKDDNNVNYNLSFTSLTAEITESYKAKRDVFIPKYFNFQSKCFKIINICDNAFKNSLIKSISFPKDSKVQRIGNFAFQNSTIRKLFIPKNLIKLNSKWLYGVNELEDIEVDKNNIFLTKESGFLIHSYQKPYEEDDLIREIVFSPRNLKGEFLIPENISSIGCCAFSQRQGIVSVKSEFPNLQKIKSFCFSNCEGLQNICFINQENLFLGDYCFTESKNLSRVDISCKTIRIGKNCFQNCTSLQTINFNENCKIKLSKQAFNGCSSLVSFLIHRALSIDIGDECFANSPNFKSVAFIAKSIILGNDLIKNCPLLLYITIESENDIIISPNTFGNSNLKYIKFVTSSMLKLKDLCFKN